jgi:hypothetical protein
MQTQLIMRIMHPRVVFAAGKDTLDGYADSWDGENVTSNAS